MKLKRKADSVSTSSDSDSSSPPLPRLQFPSSTTESTSSPPKKIKIIIRPKEEVKELPFQEQGRVQPNFSKVDWTGPCQGGTRDMGLGCCRMGLEEISPRSMTFCQTG
ncbi:hypothetical protein NEUTE2DRAFT_104345 [Neurospora tetrasperma FGSC 2509]|nr:hypothetical protein NEUTE2DRAFT_104345 [Neurospora tetrasperma FGSC 2509]